MNGQNKIKIHKIAFFCWSALILVLTSIPRFTVSSENILGVDKLAHFLLYFVLGYLYIHSFKTDNHRHQIRNLLLFAVFLPLIDEVHQIPIPGRFFSWWDVLADISGLLAVILILKLHKTES